MQASVIEFENVCFAYETEEVLHNVTFRIEPLDLVVFVGPNGGGKTTLLHLILGIHKPTRGRVRVFGQAPDKGRGRVGYVPQHVLFDPQFPVNVLDVVKMGRVERHLAGPYRSEDRAAALRALEQVELVHLRRRSFAELSGGERQRVLIAQALVCEPELLLMDEPTANVDYVVENRLYALLRELNERLTIVLVSHNLNVVAETVKHVLCVNRSAELHPASELVSEVFREEAGARLAVLHHGIGCHVIDPSAVFQAPHRAETAADKGPQ